MFLILWEFPVVIKQPEIKHIVTGCQPKYLKRDSRRDNLTHTILLCSRRQDYLFELERKELRHIMDFIETWLARYILEKKKKMKMKRPNRN